VQKKHILQLANYLPDACRWLRNRYPGRISFSLTEKFSISLNNPRFGFNFLQSFVELQLAPPAAVRTLGPELWHVYRCLVGERNDHTVAEVLSLNSVDQRPIASLLNGLLLCRDASLRQIAGDLHLTERVVKLYNDLFFCVKDRLSERSFILSLVYPTTRAAVLWGRVPPSAEGTLLIAGYEYGRQEVLRLAGLSQLEDDREIISAPTLEREVLLAARNAIRYGQHDSPALKSGIKVAMNIRRNQPDTGTGDLPDSIKGLTAVSLSYSLSDQIKAYHSGDLEHRRRLRQQEADKERQKLPEVSAEKTP
jgi:hypothetical protein